MGLFYPEQVKQFEALYNKPTPQILEEALKLFRRGMGERVV